MSEDIKKTKFWAGTILYDRTKSQVLMHKRDDKAPVNPLLWAFFGGVGDAGETAEDCVVRELQEEIGVRIEKEKLKPLRDYFNERHDSWRYVFTMEFDLDKSQMKLGEGEDFDWVPLDKVLEYDLSYSTREDLKFFLQNGK